MEAGSINNGPKSLALGDRGKIRRYPYTQSSMERQGTPCSLLLQEEPPTQLASESFCLERARNSIKRSQEGTRQCCALYPLPRGKRCRKNCIKSALDTGTTYKHQITATHPEEAMPRENQDTSTPFGTLHVWSASPNSGVGGTSSRQASNPGRIEFSKETLSITEQNGASGISTLDFSIPRYLSSHIILGQNKFF